MKIPELEKLGVTYEESFRVILTTLRHEIIYLREIHNSDSINSINDYSLLVAERIIKTANTLHSVIEKEKDYVIANMIIRSMADSISSFLLIYGEKDVNVKSLRHYLYIIDGLQNRISQLSDNHDYNGSISKKDYDQLIRQIKKAKQEYQAACVFSECQIKSLPIYATKKIFIDKLIEKHNWKFQSLESSPHERLSWQRMYDLMEFKCPSSFFSSLSEFVHGLSTTNLIFEMNSELFEPVYSFATSLLGKFMISLEEIFPKEIVSIRPKMISIFYDENTPKHLVQNLLQRYNK